MVQILTYLMETSPTRQAMPVVIFCGGTGTRLREETEYRPKPMVEVGGRPILWHIMKMYAHHGYHHFILCLGYKGHVIKDYFLRHQLLSHDFQLDLSTNTTQLLEENGKDQFQITFADTGQDTLTAERLLRASKYIVGDEFMVTYGDGVSDIDLGQLMRFYQEKRDAHGIHGVVTGVHPKSKYGQVTHDDDHVLTGFQQYPNLSDYTNAGFWVLHRDFLNYCKPGEMIEDAAISATNDRKMAIYKHDGFWHAMDTYKDKEDLEKMWKTDPKWKVWE